MLFAEGRAGQLKILLHTDKALHTGKPPLADVFKRTPGDVVMSDEESGEATGGGSVEVPMKTSWRGMLPHGCGAHAMRRRREKAAIDDIHECTRGMPVSH